MLSITRLLALVALFVYAAPAAATRMYPDHVGPSVTFSGIQETSTFGDPEVSDPGPPPVDACCFDAPTGSANQLLFFPTDFTARANGVGGFDQTGAQLQTLITGNTPLNIITHITIDEFGDVLLTDSGVLGGGGTSGEVSVSGFVTVLADTSGPLATVVPIPFLATYSPKQKFELQGDIGTTIWSASVMVHVAAHVPNATQVMLSLDNDLTATSELNTSSKIQKKVVDGPAVVITVIPEPATGALLGLGLLAVAMRRSPRRSS